MKFLLFIVLSVLAPLCYQPDAAAWDFGHTKAYDFAPGKLDEHYLKHGYQFGHITEEQYLHEAQDLLDAAPSVDILERVRPNGDVEHYQVSTHEFAVMTRRGRIRTFFKTYYRYWLTH